MPLKLQTVNFFFLSVLPQIKLLWKVQKAYGAHMKYIKKMANICFFPC